MDDELQPGDRCDQVTNTGSLVRIVRVVEIDGPVVLVEACFGMLAGHCYHVQPEALRRISRTGHSV